MVKAPSAYDYALYKITNHPELYDGSTFTIDTAHHGLRLESLKERLTDADIHVTVHSLYDKGLLDRIHSYECPTCKYKHEYVDNESRGTTSSYHEQECYYCGSDIGLRHHSETKYRVSVNQPDFSHEDDDVFTYKITNPAVRFLKWIGRIVLRRGSGSVS
jgi:hypothetical protein